MRWILALAVGCAACGGNGTGPTPPPATTQTFSGVLTATNGGQPLAGATITAGAVSAVTDATGRYSLTLPLGAQPFSIAGPGLVTRTSRFSGGGSRTVNLDAFGPGFDLEYFRQFARASLYKPLTPIVHATANVRLHIMTVDVAGQPIDEPAVQLASEVFAEWTPKLTVGRYTAIISSGPTASGGAIQVDWERTTAFCGNTEGARVVIAYDNPLCTCGAHTRRRTLKHELGHVLGFGHTGVATDLMSATSAPSCDGDPSAKELEYADYLYRRPIGNTDQDNDPPTFLH